MSREEDSFSNRLKRHRCAAGLTQRDLAQRLGVTHPCISRWEHGLASPRPEALQKLAAVLGVSPSELTFGPPVASARPRDRDGAPQYDSMSAIIEDARRRVARLQQVSPKSIAVMISSVGVPEPASGGLGPKDPHRSTWHTAWPAPKD